MRKGFFGALSILLAGTGLALAQPSPLVRMAVTGPSTDPDSVGAVKPPTLAAADKDAPPVKDAPDLTPKPAAPLTQPSVLDSGAPCHDCCVPTCTPCCDCCEKEPRYWGSVENLLWWVKEGPLPVPLVGTGAPGTLGIPAAGGSVLFGNTGLNYGLQDGVRLSGGAWLNDCRTLGVEGSFFVLFQESTHFGAASDPTGNPVLTIPITSAQTGAPSGVAISLPGAFAGSVRVTSASQFFGGDANAVYNVLRNGDLSLNALAGFRYLNLQENLNIQRSSMVLPGGNRFFLGSNVPGPSTANFADSFQTQNDFYGGQLGVRADYRLNKFTAELSAKFALGENDDMTSIRGTTTLLVPGAAPVTTPGGLLTGAFNSGHTNRSTFGWSPELGAHFGYQLTERIRLTGGYTFIYWDELARPGNQISNVVNLTQFPLSPTFGPLIGPHQPAPTFQRSDFWAQGIDLGISFSF